MIIVRENSEVVIIYLDIYIDIQYRVTFAYLYVYVFVCVCVYSHGGCTVNPSGGWSDQYARSAQEKYAKCSTKQPIYSSNNYGL